MFIAKRKTGQGKSAKIEYLAIDSKGHAESANHSRKAFRTEDRQSLQDHVDRENSGQPGGLERWEVIDENDNTDASVNDNDDDDNGKDNSGRASDTPEKAIAEAAFAQGHQLGSSEASAFRQGAEWASAHAEQYTEAQRRREYGTMGGQRHQPQEPYRNKPDYQQTGKSEAFSAGERAAHEKTVDVAPSGASNSGTADVGLSDTGKATDAAAPKADSNTSSKAAAKVGATK